MNSALRCVKTAGPCTWNRFAFVTDMFELAQNILFSNFSQHNLFPPFSVMNIPQYFNDEPRYYVRSLCEEHTESFKVTDLA